MLQPQGPKNNFWLLTADNAGALTVLVKIIFNRNYFQILKYGKFRVSDIKICYRFGLIFDTMPKGY